MSALPNSPRWRRVRRLGSPQRGRLSGHQHNGHVRRSLPATANGHTLGDVVNWKGVAYAAGASFQWNLLNYGQITNNIRLQDAKLQQLLIDYQSTVLSAQQEVDNGLATYLQSRSQAAICVAALKRQTALSKSHLSNMSRVRHHLRPY